MNFKHVLAAAVLLTACAAYAAEPAVSASTAPAQTVAVSTAPSAPAKLGSDRLDKVDAVERGVLDINAMYWAWRVTEVKDVAYADLPEYAKGWFGKPATKEKLLKAIKANIDGGKVRALTPAENKKLDDSRAAIRALMFASRAKK